MAHQQDHTSDPLKGSADMRDPRGDFRRDIRSDSDAPPSAAIERDIDQTRSRMDQTVDTLADRLRPANLMSDVLDWFASDEGARMDTPRKDKVKRVARRAGRGVMDTIKENPMPSALIAGGIAWLFLKGKDDESGEDALRGRYGYSESYFDPETGRRYYIADEGHFGDERAGGERPGMGRRLKHYTGEAVAGAKQAAGWMGEKASHAVSSLGHGVGHVAGEAGHRTSEAAGSATNAIGDTAARSWEAARHGMSRTAQRGRELSRAATHRTRSGYAYSRERMEEGFNEYPLATGAAALAAGILAGLAMPRSRREDHLFGEYAHELKHRAGDVAGEAMHRTKLAAEREGLAPHSLKDQAKDLANRVGQSANRVIESAVARAGGMAQDVAETARSEMKDLKHEAEDRGLTPSAVGEKVKHVAKEAAKPKQDGSSAARDDARTFPPPM